MVGYLQISGIAKKYPVTGLEIDTSVSNDYSATFDVENLDCDAAGMLLSSCRNHMSFTPFEVHIPKPKPNPKVKKVIYNDPATIIFWTDGTKTVVKCQEGDTYSEEKGFVMAYLKKMLGNDNTFNKEINKWVPKPEPRKDAIDIIVNSLFGGML